MKNIGVIGLSILILNFLISYKGFKDKIFFNKYKFHIDGILIGKELHRLVSSGFLHGNWMHIIFNMYCFYSFGSLLEGKLGSSNLLIIYLTSLIGGSLLSLYIHRNHGDYSAVGASGAVCGVIFASIALYPHLEVGIPFIEFSIKSWLFAIIFLVITLFGIKSKKGIIGHDAHLGGTLVGMLIVLAMKPGALADNLFIILLILVPSIIFILLILVKPEFLLIDNYFIKKQPTYYDIDHRYNEEKVNKQNEIDRILEKIKVKGIDSLTKKEKDLLDKG